MRECVYTSLQPRAVVVNLPNPSSTAPTAHRRPINQLPPSAPRPQNPRKRNIMDISALLNAEDEDRSNIVDERSHWLEYLKSLNPKVLYFYLFQNRMPNMQELHEVLQMKFVIDEAVLVERSKNLFGKYDCFIDDNMFAVLTVVLVNAQVSIDDLSLLRRISLPCCTVGGQKDRTTLVQIFNARQNFQKTK